MRALVGGGCASLVGQTIIVPFDIISQHIMVLGQLEGRGNSKVVNPLNIDYINRRRSQVLYFHHNIFVCVNKEVGVWS